MVLEDNIAVEGELHGDEEEDEEYESDPEESALSLAMMRRREASDDEEDEGERIDHQHVNPRAEIGSDAESEGGVEAYDDDEEEEEVDDEEDDGDEYEGDVNNNNNEVQRDEVGGGVGDDVERSNGDNGEKIINDDDDQEEGEGEGGEGEGGEGEGEGEGEKKENEPFAVPTAGAFYMHDDRFRENGAGRHRRTLGGRKLWESKDDRKWGHDKFEELNMREKQYDKDGRNSRGQYRGRGKTRGLDRRQARGSRPRAYDGRNTPNPPQNQPVRSVRGRGPRRYEPTSKNNFRETPTQNKQAGKSHESTSNASSGRVVTNSRTSNVQSDSAPPRKIASSLNSASPPFYPSGSSNQNITQTQRRELPGGSANKNLRPSPVSENKFPSSHPTAMARGKNVPDVVEKLYYDEVPPNLYGKLNNLQLQSSGPLPVITTQSAQSKSKGRGVGYTEQSGYRQSSSSFNPSSKVPQQAQISSVHQRAHQNQPSFRSSQQFGQHPSGVSQASSPPKDSPTSSSEPGDLDSPPGSSNSKNALVGKGKSNVQGNGRGSFLYNGALIGASGSMAVSHGDQNFPAQALLQVMQFGGQHPGGLGVPAVGMALPGYVAQPQHGFGNSEMTWVPVLAGAAGALGASYPYLVDNGYYSRPTGQPSSSSSSSKETSTDKPNNVAKDPQRSELVGDEFGQRQNRTRRYSEMNFGQ